MATSTVTLDVPSMTGGSIDLVGNVVYGTDYYDKRINQITQRTLDGALLTYDSGTNICFGTLKMENLTKSNGQDLKAWIRDKAVFSLNSFTITPPSGVDLGLGEGIAVAGVKLLATDYKDMLTFKAPARWSLVMNYQFVRS